MEPTTQEPMRGFVAISSDKGGGYRRTEEVLRRKDLRDVLIKDALADLESYQRKYDSLKGWSRAYRRLAAAIEAFKQTALTKQVKRSKVKQGDAKRSRQSTAQPSAA
jgi:hypothetical protein